MRLANTRDERLRTHGYGERECPTSRDENNLCHGLYKFLGKSICCILKTSLVPDAQYSTVYMESMEILLKDLKFYPDTDQKSNFIELSK